MVRIMKPFKGLRGDQQFVPGIMFDDERMRVLDDELGWCIVGDDGRTISKDMDAPTSASGE